MNHDVRILQLADRDALLQYERAKLSIAPGADDIEVQMQEWHAPWRTEALEHYLPLGWSFGVVQNGQIKGYFMGQPQVFTRGLTQTLWIEHIQFDSKAVLQDLVEVAYKLCREKHFQKLILPRAPQLEAHQDLFGKVELVDEALYHLKTAKI
jgi:hypothetical protein